MFMKNSCTVNGVAVQKRFTNVTFKPLIIEARLFCKTMYVSLRIQPRNDVIDSTDRSFSEELKL